MISEDDEEPLIVLEIFEEASDSTLNVVELVEVVDEKLVELKVSLKLCVVPEVLETSDVLPGMTVDSTSRLETYDEERMRVGVLLLESSDETELEDKSVLLLSFVGDV